MGIAHIAVQFCLRCQRCYRVDDYDIHCAGTYHRFRDLQPLLTVIRLVDIQVVHIHTDICRIDRIQCMLSVDKTGNAAPLLYLCDHMQGNRSLTGRFRTIDLDHTSLGNAAQTKSDIQT